jgi:antitoxin (DNA-binding transcriptional repressor) of toxin-antitoxin stability system
MRKLSIKDLHSKTGMWVRQASSETIMITDRGEPIAQLQPITSKTSAPFPNRKLQDLPKSRNDSTLSIAEERERE